MSAPSRNSLRQHARRLVALRSGARAGLPRSGAAEIRSGQFRPVISLRDTTISSRSPTRSTCVRLDRAVVGVASRSGHLSEETATIFRAHSTTDSARRKHAYPSGRDWMTTDTPTSTRLYSEERCRFESGCVHEGKRP